MSGQMGILNMTVFKEEKKTAILIMLVAQLWNSSVSLITLLTYIELQPLLVLISVNNN